VCLCHQLDGICDILAGRQRIPHALVTHGNAVTDADDAEFKGHATGSSDALADFFGQLPEVNVSRYDGIEGVCNPMNGNSISRSVTPSDRRSDRFGARLYPVFTSSLRM